uniref:Secreted protein n=1 Tax=Rhabditophanes sp. KR3021 TaxID=114890 RepID=A0AC35U1R5_9BILA
MSTLLRVLFIILMSSTLVYSFAVINRPLHSDGSVHTRRNDKNFDQQTINRFDDYIKQSFSNYDGQMLYQDKTKSSRICFFTPIQCRLSNVPKIHQITPTQIKKGPIQEVVTQSMKNQLAANLAQLSKFERLFKKSYSAY